MSKENTKPPSVLRKTIKKRGKGFVTKKIEEKKDERANKTCPQYTRGCHKKCQVQTKERKLKCEGLNLSTKHKGKEVSKMTKHKGKEGLK